MVGHESVDPKPQGKPGLVTGVTSDNVDFGGEGGEQSHATATIVDSIVRSAY